MPDQIATKTCTKCKQTFYKALFPSLKHSECKECSAARRKEYNKRFGRDSRLKWRSNLLYSKRDGLFEWERHLDLHKIP